MAFDVQTLNEAARCAECLSPNQKQNVLLYLLNGILETGGSGGGLHNLLSLTHPDTVPGPPTRGALVVGNATPDWEVLLIGAANRVLRSDGVDATWSQLVLTTDVTGVLPIANGGTNSSAALNNNRIIISSGGALVEAAALTNGQLLIGSTGAAPVAAGLTAGTNVTIGTGAGSITVNAVMPGSFSGFADPTALVGLAAVNGVATTAMRSDAAPALSQAIAPTWTGSHIFSPVAALAIQLNPFGAAAGNTSELRFLELAASGTNYTGFKAADAMAASEIYVLPDAAPSANRFLRAGAVVAGVSTLTWAQISLTADVTGILPVANGGTGASTAFTQGSVIFAGPLGVFAQDNASLFFDNTNNRLGVGTAVPTFTLHVFGPGSFQYGFAAGALVIGADLNATTISVNARKIGRVNMPSYDGGATNTFLFGGDLQSGTNDVYFGGVTGGSQYAATGLHFNTGATQTTTGGTERMTIDSAGSVGIGITSPVASLHIVPLTAPALLISPFGAAAGNTGEFRLRELTANGTNYTGFKAPDAITASEIYVLPNAAPSANRFLQAAAVAGGVSVLSWAQVSLTADVTGILPVANGGSGTSTAFTAGSVIFAGVAGVFTQDNANFFWDDTNNRLGIGTASPLNKLHIETSLGTRGLYILQTAGTGGSAIKVDATSGSGAAGFHFIQNSSNGHGGYFEAGDAGAIPLQIKGNTSQTANLFQVSKTDYGSDLFVINKDGSVGIGEATPGSKLSVSGGATVGASYDTTAAPTNGMIIEGNVGIGTTTPNNLLQVFDLIDFNNTDANTKIGYQAGKNLAVGAQYNVFIGYLAGFGGVGTAAADKNSGIGFQALYSNTTGSQNFGFGFQTLYANTTGINNIALGNTALFDLNILDGTGNNTAIGYDTGRGIITGINNTIIGANVAGLAAALSNNIIIADGAGNQRINVGSTGNVGIGVTGPAALLHVTNSAAATVASIIKAAAAQSANLTEWQDSSAVILTKINSAGNVGVRMAATALTAYLHIAAGTTAASTAPLKFDTGTSMTAAEAGAVEFTTDDLFFTITTGAARKRLLMADPVGGLTATRVPFATTNGRLTDDATMTFAAATLTVPALTVGAAGVLQVGNAAAIGAALVSTHSVTIKDSTGTTYRVPILV